MYVGVDLHEYLQVFYVIEFHCRPYKYSYLLFEKLQSKIKH